MMREITEAAELTWDELIELLKLLGESTRETMKELADLAVSAAELDGNRHLPERVTRASNPRSRRLGLLEWYPSGFE